MNILQNKSSTCVSDVHWNSEPSDYRHAATQTFLVCVYTTGKAQRERKGEKSVHKNETNDAMNKTYMHQKIILAALRGGTGWCSFQTKAVYTTHTNELKAEQQSRTSNFCVLSHKES